MIYLSDFKQQEESISSFRIAATYIGTVIGAGFASGQEILQFFGFHGFRGFWGLILTTILFIIYGYIILYVGLKCQAESYREVLEYIGGDYLGKLMDIAVTIFLLGTFTAMIAASGAIFREQFNLPYIMGNFVMLVFSAGTAILGIKGIVRSISLVVPLLLTGIIFLSIYSFYQYPLTEIMNMDNFIIVEVPASNWAFSALLYTSYNLVLAIAILGPLGANISDKNKLKFGSLMGGLGLGLGAFAILFPLLLNINEIIEFEIPMIYIAGTMTYWIQFCYSLILLFEIYTTAISNLFGIASRSKTIFGLNYKINIIMISTLVLFFSQMGFSNLIYYIYPFIGYAGLLMMIGFFYSYLKDKVIFILSLLTKFC